MKSPMLSAGVLVAALFGITAPERVLGDPPSPVAPQTNASCTGGAQDPACCIFDSEQQGAGPVCDKTRFISFTPPTDSVGPTALRVKLVSLHHVVPPYGGSPSIPFTTFEGLAVYVGPPGTFLESTASGITFESSQTQCQPYYQDWSTVGLLHVRGSAIVPSSTYQVEVLAAACMGVEDSAECQSGGSLVSAAVDFRTNRRGDVETPQNPPSAAGQPDFGDIGAEVNKFKGKPGAIIKARALTASANIFGEMPDNWIALDVGFAHIANTLDGFRGYAYDGKMGKCALSTTACTTSAECGANGPCNLYCP